MCLAERPPALAQRLYPALAQRSEAEWEAAAAFDAHGQRHSYPWGETKPTPHHTVFAQKWEQGPPDVATCPAGTAACGALDLAGTVSEWCASSWEGYPAAGARLQEDFTINEWQIPVRGGSSASNETYVRFGARNWYHPAVWDYCQGLRVVVSPF
ncbi:MAG: formylglycine-generating enzyme family protein [Oscillochloridaceae bacterium umkhey_bin13]